LVSKGPAVGQIFFACVFVPFGFEMSTPFSVFVIQSTNQTTQSVFLALNISALQLFRPPVLISNPEALPPPKSLAPRGGHDPSLRRGARPRPPRELSSRRGATDDAPVPQLGGHGPPHTGAHHPFGRHIIAAKRRHSPKALPRIPFLLALSIRTRERQNQRRLVFETPQKVVVFANMIRSLPGCSAV